MGLHVYDYPNVYKGQSNYYNQINSANTTSVITLVISTDNYRQNYNINGRIN